MGGPGGREILFSREKRISLPPGTGVSAAFFVEKSMFFFDFDLTKNFFRPIVGHEQRPRGDDNMIFQCDKSAKPAARHFLTGARHLPSNRRRFTLIEMLVVIGIAGLLFTLIGPAFNRMTRGNDVESHASGLKLGMERAASLAASSRRYVAVILPYGISTMSDPVYKYQRGGYRLAYVTRNDTGAYVFDGWLPDSEWRNPGQDAYLVEVVEGTAGTPKKAKDGSTDKMTDSIFPQAIEGSNFLNDIGSVPSGSCKGIVFSPYGDASVASSDPELKFYVTGTNFYDRVVIRLNALSGKVEFVDS